MDDNRNKDHNNEVELPAELQWDKMEDLIIDRMDQIEGKERKKRRFFFIIFLGVFVAFIIALMQMKDDSQSLSLSNNVSTDIKEKEAHEATIEGSNQDISKKESGKIVNSNTTSEVNKLNSGNHSEQVSSRGAINPRKPSESTIVIQEENGNNTINAISGTSTIQKEQRRSQNINPFSPIIELDIDQTATQAKEENSYHTGIEEGSFVSGVEGMKVISIDSKESTDRPSYTKAEYIMTLAVPPITRDTKTKLRFISEDIDQLTTPLRKQHHIGLVAGVTSWSSGYDNIKPQRSDYENNVSSYFLSGTYTYSSPKRWSFMTGLTLQNLVTAFNYSAEIEDYPITLENVIIQINQNAISGIQSFERGDVTVEVEAERLVRHYNQLQSLQVPFAFGYVVSRGRWNLDIQAGATVNVLTQHQGKTLVNSNIIVYDNDVNQIIRTDISASWLVGTQLLYRIRPRWGIVAALQYQSMIGNASLEQNIVMKPKVFTIGLGLSYHL